MEVATSSLRSRLSASFRAWWETASRPLRIFTVGGSTVGVSVLLIQVSGPDRLDIPPILSSRLNELYSHN